MSSIRTKVAGIGAARPASRATDERTTNGKGRRDNESETTGIVLPAVRLLNQMPGVWAMRVNSGVAKVGRHRIVLAPEGTADIMATVDGRTFWFEGKRPGEKLSHAQREFSSRVLRAGARYFVITEAKQAVLAVQEYQRGTLDADE